MVDQPIAEPVNREVLDKRRSLRNASGNLLDIHRHREGKPGASTWRRQIMLAVVITDKRQIAEHRSWVS